MLKYDFEKLQVYQKAMNFADTIYELTESFPARLQFSLGDQFRRASLSVCNNIAEGSQKRGAARRQFYSYALNSSRECIPMLELSHRRKLISKEVHQDLYEECFSIGSMIYKLIQSSL